jgi:hypothetical protein
MVRPNARARLTRAPDGGARTTPPNTPHATKQHKLLTPPPHTPQHILGVGFLWGSWGDIFGIHHHREQKEYPGGFIWWAVFQSGLYRIGGG